MRFNVLGPIEAHQDGRALAIGGGRQMALLGLLLVHAGEVVSRDRLIDELWAGDPPASADRSLDAYVSRLRRAMRDAGAEDLLDTRAPGYLLRAADTDLAEFHALVDTGQLRDALELWRGRPFSDVADEPWARAAVDRLEELRLTTIEARVDADLDAGRQAELVGELEGLAHAHPTRERLVGQLMLALYRAGRQSDALAVFREVRARLVEDLGLEPGPELRRLEAAILAHDPALDRPAGAPRERPAARSEPRKRPRVRWHLPVAAAALAAVVIAVIAVGGGDDGPRAPVPVLTAEGAGALDPGSGRVLASVPAGAGPAGITSAGGRIWVTNGGFGAVWVANSQSSTVSRVDTATGDVVQTIAGAARPVAIATGENAVWVADAGDSAVVELDPGTGSPSRTIRLSDQPAGVAVGFGSIWVTEPLSRRLVRLDPRSGAITAEVNVGGGAGPVAIGSGAVWVLNRLDGTLSRVDPQTEAITSTAPVGDAPHDVAASDAGVFVADQNGVAAINPASGAVRRRFAIGAAATAVTLVGRTPWVATDVPTGTAHRGGTLRVVGDDAMQAFDPAFSSQVHPSMWHATGDGLTTVVNGGGAAQLVPDLALALPKPTQGGRVYRFRLRPGIRYSNGAPLRASDVRRGFERLFTSSSDSSGLLRKLRGAAACSPKRCDLSAGIVADDAAGTVELRLTRPDPLLLFELSETAARPVPPGTTGVDPRRTVPSTGPYKVARFEPGRELDLVRNPYFRSWSAAAQPDGYPDRIEYRIVKDARARADAVVNGKADLAFDIGPAPDLETITTRYASQVKRHVQPLVVYATLNALAPPFDDVRLRRALDMALDRRAVVTAMGGPDLAQPACQILPPTIPGHAPYCPRSTGPDDGPWHGADLRAARALVRASGTDGMRVDYVAWTGDPDGALVAPVVVRALRRLGYRSRSVLLDDLGKFAVRASAGTIPVSQVTWTSDFPSASEFMVPFLACRSHNPDNPPLNTNFGGYCNHALDRLMAASTAAGATNPGAGNRLWARADRMAIDDAAMVPLVDINGIELLSRRTGHFSLDATSLPRADQLWVR